MAQFPKPKKVASLERLRDAWNLSKDSTRIGASPGVDRVSPAQFRNDLDRNLRIVRSHLLSDQFDFSLLRPVPIPKGSGDGVRIICVPTVADRLTQRVIANYLNEKDKLGIDNKVSYGFRKGLGVPHAVKRAKRLRDSYPYAFKSDITSFFDSIDREVLKNDIARRLGRSSVVPLLWKVIECEIDDSDNEKKKDIEKAGIVRGHGLRQGMPLSPMLSNFVLKDFDRTLQKKKIKLVRYADDFIIFAKTEDECYKYFDLVRELLLKKNHEIPKLAEGSKTVLRQPAEPIDFLGFELALSKTGKTYQIFAPPQAFDKIKTDLKDYSNFPYAFKKYRRLSRVISRIDSVTTSFVNAYKPAKNYSDLESHANNCKNTVIRTLLVSIFGKKAFNNMDPIRLEFLGIRHLP